MTAVNPTGSALARPDDWKNSTVNGASAEETPAVKWSRNTAGSWVSHDGCYEIAARYVDGHFAWRGREVSTDKLICSSIDPEFVKRTCESHAASVAAEHTS
jgi:hypothetical protein